VERLLERDVAAAGEIAERVAQIAACREREKRRGKERLGLRHVKLSV
jgi:hypothetical protein